MAKFISLKFKPTVGTEFDYLVNVEDIVNIVASPDVEMFVASGETLAFPLDVAGSDDYQGLQMLNYIKGLFLDAKQRGGNHYIVAAEDGPFDITAFA